MNSVTTYAISSKGPAATLELGRRLGQCLRLLPPAWPLAVELIGDLGAGKTTFVQGLAAGLGSTSQVTSPTFTINRSYTLNDGRRLEHFDLYRLGEMGVMGEELAEALTDHTAVTAIEWPQQSANLLPADRLVINFVTTGESERQINFKATGEKSSSIVEMIKP